MIKITHKNLEKIANEHFEKIKDKVNIPKNQLREIILAKPNKLQDISLKYKRYNDEFKNKYKNFTSKKEEYNAYVLAKKLNIQICPYCNRNTIYNLKYAKKRTSEFDHFYPQSTYPILGLSFYNLILSCKVCNQLKRDKDNNFLNPYDERFDFNKNAKFDIKLKDSSFAYSTDGFKIICKTNKDITKAEKSRIKNNIQVFKLNDLYQNHKDIVLELIQKREIYPDSYIDELAHNYSGLFKNREDLLRLITCGYIEDKDINKRPLNKLIKDISEELELI